VHTTHKGIGVEFQAFQASLGCSVKQRENQCIGDHRVALKKTASANTESVADQFTLVPNFPPGRHTVSVITVAEHEGPRSETLDFNKGNSASRHHTSSQNKHFDLFDKFGISDRSSHAIFEKLELKFGGADSQSINR
jgi:hypothetical protein